MRMIIDVSDDTPLNTMQKMHDDIQKKYKEYVVDMGWVIEGKFVRNKELEEQEIKQGTKDPFDNMFGPKKGSDFSVFGDKKDEDNGFSFL